MRLTGKELASMRLRGLQPTSLVGLHLDRVNVTPDSIFIDVSPDIDVKSMEMRMFTGLDLVVAYAPSNRDRAFAMARRLTKFSPELVFLFDNQFDMTFMFKSFSGKTWEGELFNPRAWWGEDCLGFRRDEKKQVSWNGWEGE